MSTIADYKNRTSDFAVFRLPLGANRDQQVDLALMSASDGGQLVTGIQKLLQHFALILLTKKGSVTHDPTRGTTFLIDATRGRWRTPADIRLSFVAAQADARRQLLAEEDATDPLDEKYKNAELTDAQITPGSVKVWITVRSMAGDSYTFIAPIAATTR